MAAFHQIKARKAGSTDRPLVLTFSSRKQFEEFETRCILRRDIEVVDVSPGYRLFTTADEAEKELNFWLR